MATKGSMDPEHYHGMTVAQIEAELIVNAGPDYLTQIGTPPDPAMFGLVAQAIHDLVNGGNKETHGWKRIA